MMVQIGFSKKRESIPIDENLLRHMILNVIRTYVKKFNEYGQVVIACDNKNYWRKQAFPYYKITRKKMRTDSGLDWNNIFTILNKIRDELKECAPYKVLDVDGAEGDDVIAALVQYYTEPTMILSSDKDFPQLQILPWVKQYSPIMGKFIKAKNPQAHLKELIIRGDKSDAIPNILSADNSFKDNIRQKSIMEDKFVVWMKQTPNEICVTETMKHGWSRNESLIDLSKMPDDLRKKIIYTYENGVPAPMQKFMSYMMEKRLKNLLECITEFRGGKSEATGFDLFKL